MIDGEVTMLKAELDAANARALDAIANVERLTGQIETLKAKHAEATTQLITRDRQINRLQEQLTAAEERVHGENRKLLDMYSAYHEKRDRVTALETALRDAYTELTCGCDLDTYESHADGCVVGKVIAALAPAPATAAKDTGAAFFEFAAQLGPPPTSVLATSEPGETQAPADDGLLHDRIHPTSGRLLSASPIIAKGETQAATCAQCDAPAGTLCELCEWAAELPKEQAPNCPSCDDGLPLLCRDCSRSIRDEYEPEIAKLRADLEAATKRSDALAVALANVSGALCDAGVVVPDDASRYGEAVREIGAGAAAMRASIESLLSNPHGATTLADGRHSSGFCRTCADQYAAGQDALSGTAGRAFLERLRAIDDENGALKEKLKGEREAHAVTRTDFEAFKGLTSEETMRLGKERDTARRDLALAQQRADAEVERRVTAEAALGRAVAAMRDAWPQQGVPQEAWYRERDAILADPACAAAGEAWREEQELIAAMVEYDRHSCPHDTDHGFMCDACAPVGVALSKRMSDALAKVAARRDA